MKPYLMTLIVTILFLSLHNLQASNTQRPKNVILLIGDGMGISQVTLLRQYLKYGNNKNYNLKSSGLAQITTEGTTALAVSEAYESLTTDSAASATHLASGKISRQKMIGIDYQGRNAKSIMERAKSKGLSIGVISDTRLTHATPASFLSHTQYREDEFAIAEKMIISQPDLMLSAGSDYFLPQKLSHKDKKWIEKLPRQFQNPGKREDSKNLLREAQSKGIKLVFTKDQLTNNASTNAPLLGLFHKNAFPDGISRSHNLNATSRKYPTLKEMTEVGLKKLSKNKKGFVLMVEAGQIDWAGHRNDAGWLLHEMLHFEDTLSAIMKFAKEDKNTLVVVTADHETGGFAWSYKYSNVPKPSFLNYDLKGESHNSTTDPIHTPLLDKLYLQKRSAGAIVRDFTKLPKSQQTPTTFRDMINASLPFQITKKDAKKILKVRSFKITYQNGKNMQRKVPKFDEESQPFYASNHFVDRTALIARLVSDQSGIRWATGGHTGAAIPVFAYGPYSKNFSGFYHNTEINKRLREALDL